MKSIEIITNNSDDLVFEYKDQKQLSIVLNEDMLIGKLNRDDVIELIGFLSQFVDQALDEEL